MAHRLQRVFKNLEDNGLRKKKLTLMIIKISNFQNASRENKFIFIRYNPFTRGFETMFN